MQEPVSKSHSSRGLLRSLPNQPSSSLSLETMWLSTFPPLPCAPPQESEVARLSAIASALPDMEAQLREVQEDKRELQGRLALSEAERGYLNKEMQVKLADGSHAA